MAAQLAPRKRRASGEWTGLADDLLNGSLDGALSQSDDGEDESSDGSYEEPLSDEDDDHEGHSGQSQQDEVEDTEPSDGPEEDAQDEALGRYMKERRNSYSGTKAEGAEAEDGESAPNYQITTDADGNVRYVYEEIDPVYDSDDTDAQQPENTIGNIPLSFYE